MESDVRILCHKGVLMRAAGAACLIVLAWSAAGKGQEQPQVNRGLRILYAGRPGSDREKDFVSFLRNYFDVVQTGALRTFQETDTLGFDVTLLDWDPADSSFDMNRFRLPLSPSFSRPVITFGIPGGWMCQRWRLRMAYS